VTQQATTPTQGAPTTAELESFYEGYVEHHVPFHRSPRGWKGMILRWLPYWSWREWRFWRQHVPRGGILLDLGCARGREIFVERAALCVGLDIASTALRDCARRYAMALRSTLEALPFRSDSLDTVVTSHVLGHVPAEQKDSLIAEMARVLKPGGKTLHVIETDSRHPYVLLAKRDPAAFRKYFIEPDGHIGLEMPAAVIARFERHGLRCVHCTKMDAGPFHPRLFLKHFDNEFRRRWPLIERRARLHRWIMRHASVLAATEVLLGLHHYTLGQWLPLDRSQFVAAIFEKPARSHA
jgi:SAM-dependent methyltransferase